MLEHNPAHASICIHSFTSQHSENPFPFPESLQGNQPSLDQNQGMSWVQLHVKMNLFSTPTYPGLKERWIQRKYYVGKGKREVNSVVIKHPAEY